MAGILLCGRARLRRAATAWMIVATLVAGSGAAALGALAAARRTASAPARLQAEVHSPDALFFGGNPSVPGESLPLESVARLPEVRDLTSARLMLAGPERPDGSPDPAPDNQVMASADGGLLLTVGGLRLVHGRNPRPDAADEVVMTVPEAKHLGLRVGDRLTLRTLTFDDLPRLAELAADPTLPIGRRVAVVVVGIGVADGFTVGYLDGAKAIIGGPAFLRENAESAHVQFAGVRLRRGVADIDAFRQDLRRQFGDVIDALELGDVGGRTQAAATIQRAIRPEVTALALFAALAPLVGLVLLLQAVARQVRADAPWLDELRAIGFTRAQLAGVALAPTVVAGAVGAVVAAVVALLASPLGPVGLARPLEPDAGVRFDPTVLLAGPAVLFGVTLALAVPLVWWSLRRSAVDATRRPGGPALRTPLPVAVIVGIRGALGRHRDGAPAGVAGAGLAVGAGALAAAVMFAGSLDHLVHTPRLYGWESDATVFDNYGQVDDDAIAAALAAEPAVADFAPRLGGTGTIGGHPVGLQAVDGTAYAPVLTAGRAPTGDDEVVLGRRTRRQAHTRVGGTVQIAAGDTTRSFRVVGEAVLAGSLGDGARLTPAGVRSLLPDAEVDTFLLRFRPGADPEAAIARLSVPFQHLPVGPEIERPARPVDVANLERVGSLPFLLAGVLALGALASLVHALAVGRRRRRRELAVLRSIGFTGRQVAFAVVAQAVTLTGAGLAVGLPLGIAAGRSLWRLFADELGVVADPATSVPFLVAAVPVAVLLTLAVAAVPARGAVGLRPALALRTE